MSKSRGGDVTDLELPAARLTSPGPLHLASPPPTAPELVRQLRGELHHHATDEENEQFPQLRARIPADKLVQMREQVQTAKK